MYATSTPVTAGGFFDREDELARLGELIRSLQAGTPAWLDLVGPRKIGKTSLLLELSRRISESSLAFVVMDCFEELPLRPDIFRRYALRVVDAALGTDLGSSLEALAARPAEFRAELQKSERFAQLPPTLRSEILELTERQDDPKNLRIRLDLPERLGEALEILFLVAWDEFQELAALSSGGAGRDLIPLLRSRWQRHRRTAYVISGSARAMLTELVTDERSPFFQHFSVMELGQFVEREAKRLLRENAPPEWQIPDDLAHKCFEVVGGHPFYLQLLGEALIRRSDPESEDPPTSLLKDALQELLFSRTGRLALYFQNELQRLVGRSGYLAKTLEALTDGPLRLSEVARAIDSPSGSTVRYLERLKDAVERDPEGPYRLADPVFGLWLSWRRPGGTVVPMRVVGDEAELAAAERLARMGFDLIYQSRASRGTFDLLATRGPHQLGVQVKRSALPLRFRSAEWRRMEADAERLGWLWVVAAVTPPPENRVRLLDPAGARAGKGVRLHQDAEIQNLLRWIDCGGSYG